MNPNESHTSLDYWIVEKCASPEPYTARKNALCTQASVLWKQDSFGELHGIQSKWGRSKHKKIFRNHYVKFDVSIHLVTDFVTIRYVKNNDLFEVSIDTSNKSLFLTYRLHCIVSNRIVQLRDVRSCWVSDAKSGQQQIKT